MLVIAGSDSSGGAGLQRDLQMLSLQGAPARSVVTAVTSQTNCEVSHVHLVPTKVIEAQIEAAFAMGDVDAIKIGMLGSAEIVHAVASSIGRFTSIPIVVDPVLASSSGRRLLDEGGRAALVGTLYQSITLLTPNLPEAAILLDQRLAENITQQIDQALQLEALLHCPILLKGGHSAEATIVDILCQDGRISRLERDRRLGSPRGTGCALSTSIALRLARGARLLDACQKAHADIRWLWQ